MIKTLSDYLALGHAPFKDIETIGVNELAPIFTLVTGTDLDMMLDQDFGDRLLYLSLYL